VPLHFFHALIDAPLLTGIIEPRLPKSFQIGPSFVSLGVQRSRRFADGSTLRPAKSTDTCHNLFGPRGTDPNQKYIRTYGDVGKLHARLYILKSLAEMCCAVLYTVQSTVSVWRHSRKVH
jgi:hypothetical protein